jgi:hypothetical protein
MRNGRHAKREERREETENGGSEEEKVKGRWRQMGMEGEKGKSRKQLNVSKVAGWKAQSSSRRIKPPRQRKKKMIGRGMQACPWNLAGSWSVAAHLEKTLGSVGG